MYNLEENTTNMSKLEARLIKSPMEGSQLEYLGSRKLGLSLLGIVYQVSIWEKSDISTV